MRPHEVRRKREEARAAPRAARAFSLPAWQWGPGAWEAGAEALGKLGQPLLLAGEASLLQRYRKQAVGAFLEAGLELNPHALPDGAECCEPQAKALAEAAKAKGAQALVGLGGGKALDLVKWAGLLSGLPVATLPTSPATCACATSVVVANTPEGEFESVLDLAGPPALVLADTGVLRQAPARLLAAGLADTLAKHLEWAVLEEVGDAKGGAQAMEGARRAAELGAQALADPSSAAMDAVLEACLRLSSEASCLGEAPAAVAHSLANGLSRLPEGRALLHGGQVALGLLVQDRLLEALGLPRAEPSGKALESLLLAWGLPTRLPALPDGGLDLILEKAMHPQETLHLLPQRVDAAALRDVLQSLQGPRPL